MSTQYLLVSETGGLEPMGSFGEVNARIVTLAALAQTRTDALGRTLRDTDGYSYRGMERHLDSVFGELRQRMRDMQRRGDRRADDFAASLGAGLSPRDLTHRMRRVLEQAHPPLTSEIAFAVNTEIQPGAMSWEQVRTYASGEAIVYRGGSGADIPTVGIGGATARGNIVYLVSKAAMDWLESLVTNRIGLDTQARKMRAAELAIRQLTNRWNWTGASEYGIYGVYNNPYIDTALSTVAYTDDSAADDIASDYGVWANYAENESGSVFQPNTVCISPVLLNYLRNRRYGDNADKSLWDWMMSANPHITRVVPTRELNDVGGTNVHGMFFCRTGGGPTDSSVEILSVLPPTLLPPDTRALASEYYMVAATGGLHQTQAGDNLLVLVTGP